jgi:Uncharacterised nucleotidyltransferase
MLRSRFPIRSKPTPRSSALKEAIVGSFALDPGLAVPLLAGFEEADWLSVLWWLDISGMAIYFYDHARQIGADAILPRSISEGLALRLSNNRFRMKSLLNEARVLAAWFESERVPYALLKGGTLTPHSVRDSALRCQTDLDFLVAERSAELAIHSIHRLGYRLHAQSGSTLEFRAGAASLPDLANLYSVRTQRALELHLAKDMSCEFQLLSRREKREIDGVEIYALSPEDILIEQARHLLKHLCGEHTRLSWVLEFWRHVRNRRGDDAFWHRVESCAAGLTHGDLAMGVAAWVAEDFFGGTRAEIPLCRWVEALPVRVRLWLERYAHRLLVSDTIGNKLYALLCKEVPRGLHRRRGTCQILLPRVLPAAVLKAQPQENWWEKRARYCVEAQFVLWRLWFHLREDIRFAIEFARWNRTVAREGR